MSKEKINQALRQLSDALTEEYGTLPYGHRRHIDISVSCIDATCGDDEQKRLVYSVRLEVDATEEESMDTKKDQPCCRSCQSEAMAASTALGILPNIYFIACQKCGNKRCPKAENHAYKCTGSNDVNQTGELE